MDNPNLSLAFYDYLCAVVGSEETVRIRRYISNTYDNVNHDGNITIIGGGSKAEGFDFVESDFDGVQLINRFPVFENKNTVRQLTEQLPLVMETTDCKPGYTLLRRNVSLKICMFCEARAKKHKHANRQLPESFPFLMGTTGGAIGYALIHLRNASDLDFLFEHSAGVWYFSSSKFRNCSVLKHNPFNLSTHGPCNSPPDRSCDIAMCLRCSSWISEAKPWILRSQNSWASNDVIRAILEFGVQFFPVGCKNSLNNDLEWRISFSYAEKLLIWSFNHVQFLCYGLLKILFKDLIEEATGDLLCSYFLKTIMLWICEETKPSQWKATNILFCFMRCLDRLIYCVRYKTCAHYFISENDFFAERFDRQQHSILLSTLNQLRGLGWICLLQTKTLRSFGRYLVPTPSLSIKQVSYLQSLWFFCVVGGDSYYSNLKQSVYGCILSRKKDFFLYAVSIISSCISQELSNGGISCNGNKDLYDIYCKRMCHLLIGLNHDAVSGWFLLASFFYVNKQYEKCKGILSECLLICKSFKIHLAKFMLTEEDTFFNNMKRVLGFNHFENLRLIKKCIVKDARFLQPSEILPDELRMFENNNGLPIWVPPVVFCLFLKFLCDHHLGNERQKYESLRTLEIVVQNGYFIKTNYNFEFAHTILSIAYSMCDNA